MNATQTYLETAMARVAKELAEGDIKPSYSVDGQSFSWTEYRAHLLEEMALLRGLANDADEDGGIAFVQTETYT